MYDIIVLGGGPSGVTAALRARELGAMVALVERNRLGGTCTNDGCVPTRVLAHAARLRREAEQFGDYGLIAPPPEVDFARLMGRVQHIVYRIHEKKQLIGHLEDSGVTVYSGVGGARFIDRHTISLADGDELQAERFILCVGGHARRLNFPGAEYALTHSDVWSMKKLPASLVIVGGAATGCQLASIFNAFGTRVHLLELSPQILAIEDEMVGKTMRKAFERRGIQVITRIGGVDHIEKQADGLVLFYGKEGELRSIQAEAVIMAAGWPGNVDELNLEAAGVKSEHSFVLVDDYFRTSTENIFAAGDITGRMMLVQSGGYEARAAAENAVLGAGERHPHLIVPHGGFTDPEYASVGLSEKQASDSQDCLSVVVPYADMDRAVIDDHTEGFCKLVVSQENHRLLGAHVVGEQALEITQLVAAGMTADIWVEQLADLEIAYPTYSAILGLAARHLVRELGVMPLSPQWRALGRAHAAEWEQENDAL
jgi:pyruvate/2-oxoglutarate dehydrogenase complex dihydrolipoamide dehydrogenase (E3) component